MKTEYQKFELESPETKTPFLLELGSRKRDLFTDFTIRVEGKAILAHKLFLAGSSLYFYDMFILQENKKVLTVKDVSFEVMEKMINFVYEDKVENMENIGKSLLIAANTVNFLLTVPGLVLERNHPFLVLKGASENLFLVLKSRWKFWHKSTSNKINILC